MPEIRRWFKESFDGGYLGLHLIGGQYNAGGLKFPRFLKDKRYDGWAVGAGISYGHSWALSRKFSLEVSAGVGYMYLRYDKFRCGACGDKEGSFRRNYIGPTKAAISLVYHINGGKPKKAVPTVIYRPVAVHDTIYITPEAVPEPVKAATDTVAPRHEAPEPVTVPSVKFIEQRGDSMSLGLIFPVNGSEIFPRYLDNREGLSKVDSILRSLTGNPEKYRLTDITIHGYASPEGTWDYNMTLSTKRALAMSEYLRNRYRLTDSTKVKIVGHSEDWEGLRNAISGCGMEWRDDALEIIDSNGIYEGREKKLMDYRGGEPYQWMKRQLFPRLRRIEMTANYLIINKSEKEQ